MVNPSAAPQSIGGRVQTGGGGVGTTVGTKTDPMLNPQRIGGRVQTGVVGVGTMVGTGTGEKIGPGTTGRLGIGVGETGRGGSAGRRSMQPLMMQGGR